MPILDKQSSAAAALNDYARSNNPFDELGKTQAAVEVSSVISSVARQRADPEIQM